VFFDKLIQSISNDLHEFPLVLSPTDQGLFFLGYYQQRQVFFQKHTAETNEVAAE
jgi:ABC-type molybdate transport system permease subunit